MYHNVSVVPHINSEHVIGLLQKTRKAQLCDTCIIPGAYQHFQGSTQQEERVKCLKLLYEACLKSIRPLAGKNILVT